VVLGEQLDRSKDARHDGNSTARRRIVEDQVTAFVPSRDLTHHAQSGHDRWLGGSRIHCGSGARRWSSLDCTKPKGHWTV
jgi:hypothetical protein